MMMIPITEGNLDLAVGTHRAVFPHEDATENYRDAIEGRMDGEYYILWHEDACVGVSGIYFRKEEPDGAWLGWFGILPEYRRKGLGSMALKQFEEEAAKRGFGYVRLYIDADNSEAIGFCVANGYAGTPHLNKSDILAAGGPILVFSKAVLPDRNVPRWRDRSIGLAEQMRKQALHEQGA